MSILDATSRSIALYFGGVDFAQSLVGEFAAEPEFSELSGLRTLSGQLTLYENVSTPEPLDPEINTRWVIGQTIDVWIADTQGILRRHPGLGLRILTVPSYNEIWGFLDIEFCCELQFWAERTPAADCSGVDPRTGRPADQVISSLLIAAGITAGLEPGPANPAHTVNYPLQKFSGESFVSQAGLVALSSPGGPRYLWADGQRRIRCDYLANPATPLLTLTESDLIDLQRTNPADYARPFERLKLTAPQVIVRPYTYPRTLQPQEQYATIPELFPDQPLVNVDATRQYLVEGGYGVETWDGASVRQLRTRFRRTYFVISTVTGVGGTNFRSFLFDAGESIENWTFHPRPSSWNSCRPEENPRSNAGLIKRYEKVVTNGDAIVDGAIVQSPNKGLPRYREITDYTYDDRQNLVRQLNQKYFPVATTSGQVFGTELVPMRLNYQEDITWIEEAPGNGYWFQTTKIKAPGGNASNAAEVTNGVERLPVTDGVPVTVEDSPPPQVPTMPTGFTVAEERLEVFADAPPRGGGAPQKTKTLSVPYATNEAQLQDLADFLANLYWGRAFGRKVALPLPDALLDANLYRPLQRWRIVSPIGEAIDLRVEDPVFVLSRDECLVGFEAGQIGRVVSGGITPVYQPVTRAAALLGMVVEGRYTAPPMPALSGEAILGLFASQGALRWRDLTLQQWRDLDLEQWRLML